MRLFSLPDSLKDIPLVDFNTLISSHKINESPLILFQQVGSRRRRWTASPLNLALFLSTQVAASMISHFVSYLEILQWTASCYTTQRSFLKKI